MSEPAEQTASARPRCTRGTVRPRTRKGAQPRSALHRRELDSGSDDDVVSRLGEQLRVPVRCAPLKDGDGARGAILVMEEVGRGES